MRQRRTATAQREMVAQLAADLGWDAARLRGFSQRIVGADEPTTIRQYQQVILGLQAVLMQRMRPHLKALTALIARLQSGADALTAWERGFVADAGRKVGGRSLTPRMVKKVREIAHKHEIECGFPSFRELAESADRERAARQDVEGTRR